MHAPDIHVLSVCPIVIPGGHEDRQFNKHMYFFAECSWAFLFVNVNN